MILFKRFCMPALALTISFFYASYSYASGYLLNEYSVTSMGRAFAGVGVVGDDFSAVASNPAGMQLFSDTFGVQAGVTVITLNGKFDGTVNAPALGFSERGSARVQIQSAVPNFFAAYSINDRLKAGIGVYVPFGLGTEYPESSIVRYSAIKSDLMVIEIAPALSFNVWRGLTIGAALNVQYGTAQLTQVAPTSIGSLGVAYPTAELKGEDWAVGGTVGIMYDFGETAAGETTRLGLSYRSQVKHDIKGDLDVNLASLSFSKSASADLNLPNTVTLSAYHKFYAPVGLSATLRYIQWSCFDTLDIKGSGNPPIHEDWRDTVSAHLGADWFVNDYITLRAGAAYDMTPIRDPEHRTARIPDNDRFLLSLGLSAAISKHWTIDVGYTHMFLHNSSIDHTYAGLDINGKYKYDFLSYLIGGQIQFKF